MTAADVAAAGQAAAEELMVDSCVISAPGAAGTFDPATLGYTGAAAADVYTGKCRIRRQATQEHGVEAGESLVSLRGYLVQIPMLVTGMRNGLHFRCTASRDPDLVDKTGVVIDVIRGTHQTARRLIVEEIA